MLANGLKYEPENMPICRPTGKPPMLKIFKSRYGPKKLRAVCHMFSHVKYTQNFSETLRT